jgi:hypothetical protein
MPDFDAYYGEGWINLSQTIIFPNPLVAGDTWTFQRHGGRWISSGWNAQVFIAAQQTKLAAQALADEDWYQWQIQSTDTAKLTAQPYAYNVNVTSPDGSQRITIEQGAIQVISDISAPGCVEPQTNLQKMLAAVDLTLIKLLSKQTSMAQFAGQMYQTHDIDKLFTVREKLSVRVADEQEELRGNRRNRRIVTVFRTQ